MIKSIQISNFQSHKSTKLKFDSGVNVIVGSSDSGKSAILRAMLWAISNRPSGESFRSYWGGDTIVDIELENEVVTREKGKENLYIISPEDAKSIEFKPLSIEFKAFGTGVPEEIESLLNISDINIQRQMDAPFLLSSTPGEVSKTLNRAVRLDIIDKAQSNIQSILKRKKNILLNTQNTIEDKQDELKRYKWLPKAQGCIVKLKIVASQISQTANLAMDLRKAIDDINTNDASLKKASLILAYSQAVEDLIDIDNDINLQTDLWNNINDVVQNIIEDEKKIESLSELIRAENRTNEMIKNQQDCVKLRREGDRIRNLIQDIAHHDRMMIVAKDNLNKRKKEFEVAMPNICPLCSQEIK